MQKIRHYIADNSVLRRQIPNPEVPCSKPLGGSKVDPTFHLSDINQISIKNFWELSGKKKLPLRSGSVALRELNLIHQKGPQSLFFLNNVIYKKPFLKYNQNFTTLHYSLITPFFFKSYTHTHIHTYMHI